MHKYKNIGGPLKDISDNSIIQNKTGILYDKDIFEFGVNMVELNIKKNITKRGKREYTRKLEKKELYNYKTEIDNYNKKLDKNDLHKPIVCQTYNNLKKINEIESLLRQIIDSQPVSTQRTFQKMIEVENDIGGDDKEIAWKTKSAVYYGTNLLKGLVPFGDMISDLIEDAGFDINEIASEFITNKLKYHQNKWSKDVQRQHNLSPHSILIGKNSIKTLLYFSPIPPSDKDEYDHEISVSDPEYINYYYFHVRNVDLQSMIEESTNIEKQLEAHYKKKEEEVEIQQNSRIDTSSNESAKNLIGMWENMSGGAEGPTITLKPKIGFSDKSANMVPHEGIFLYQKSNSMDPAYLVRKKNSKKPPSKNSMVLPAMGKRFKPGLENNSEKDIIKNMTKNVSFEKAHEHAKSIEISKRSGKQGIAFYRIKYPLDKKIIKEQFGENVANKYFERLNRGVSNNETIMIDLTLIGIFDYSGAYNYNSGKSISLKKPELFWVHTFHSDRDLNGLGLSKNSIKKIPECHALRRTLTMVPSRTDTFMNSIYTDYSTDNKDIGESIYANYAGDINKLYDIITQLFSVKFYKLYHKYYYNLFPQIKDIKYRIPLNILDNQNNDSSQDNIDKFKFIELLGCTCNNKPECIHADFFKKIDKYLEKNEDKSIEDETMNIEIFDEMKMNEDINFKIIDPIDHETKQHYSATVFKIPFSKTCDLKTQLFMPIYNLYKDDEQDDEIFNKLDEDSIVEYRRGLNDFQKAALLRDIFCSEKVLSKDQFKQIFIICKDIISSKENIRVDKGDDYDSRYLCELILSRICYHGLKNILSIVELCVSVEKKSCPSFNKAIAMIEGSNVRLQLLDIDDSIKEIQNIILKIQIIPEIKKPYDDDDIGGIEVSPGKNNSLFISELKKMIQKKEEENIKLLANENTKNIYESYIKLLPTVEIESKTTYYEIFNKHIDNINDKYDEALKEYREKMQDTLTDPLITDKVNEIQKVIGEITEEISKETLVPVKIKLDDIVDRYKTAIINITESQYNNFLDIFDQVVKDAENMMVQNNDEYTLHIGDMNGKARENIEEIFSNPKTMKLPNRYIIRLNSYPNTKGKIKKYYLAFSDLNTKNFWLSTLLLMKGGFKNKTMQGGATEEETQGVILQEPIDVDLQKSQKKIVFKTLSEITEEIKSLPMTFKNDNSIESEWLRNKLRSDDIKEKTVGALLEGTNKVKGGGKRRPKKTIRKIRKRTIRKHR